MTFLLSPAIAGAEVIYRFEGSVLNPANEFPSLSADDEYVLDLLVEPDTPDGTPGDTFGGFTGAIQQASLRLGEFQFSTSQIETNVITTGVPSDPTFNSVLTFDFSVASGTASLDGFDLFGFGGQISAPGILDDDSLPDTPTDKLSVGGGGSLRFRNGPGTIINQMRITSFQVLAIPEPSCCVFLLATTIIPLTQRRKRAA